MVEPNVLELLNDFGMTEREAKLYLAMLKVPEATAADLHRISGVLRTKTYETLEQMLHHGYCTDRLEGRNRYYRAIPPVVLHETLQRRWDTEWNRRREQAKTLFTTLEKDFLRDVEADRALDLIQVIRTADQINRKYIELVNSTEKELLAFTRSPYACLDKSVLAEQEKAQTEAIKRGVVNRSIYMHENQDWSWVEEVFHESVAAGEEARVIGELPVKMFVFDRRTVLLALPSIPGQTGVDFTMIVIEDEGFTRMCSIMFEYYWNQSSTYEEWAKKNNKG